MTPENAQRDRRALEVFGRAIGMADAGSRAAFIESACGGDERLKVRVRTLLALDVADSLSQQPAAVVGQNATVLVPITEKPGDRIGRYKLLQQIGEGGCGVVCMAEQEEPVRRRVALKVIKLGMDTKSVIARFEAERQALALMDHPNIAKVFDAGAIGTSNSPLSSPLSTSPGPALLRHGVGPGRQDHRLLRPEKGNGVALKQLILVTPLSLLSRWMCPLVPNIQ